MSNVSITHAGFAIFSKALKLATEMNSLPMLRMTLIWTVEGTYPLAGHYHSKSGFLGPHFRKNLQRSCRKARSAN
jgi:hypothetical protein